MKTIIDGLRYDPENSEPVASYQSSHTQGDFRRLSETLYLTPNGRWFLYGEGGPKTQYAERVADGWIAGSAIKPLAPEQAMEWLERHDQIDALEAHFGEAIRDA